MLYYKAFNKNLMCRGMQYEIGQEYKFNEKPILCKRGFHFCKTIADCYKFYSMDYSTRICEVEPLGEIVEDESGIKLCTNHIKIIREIKNPREKSNTSISSSGFCNSGYFNTGKRNSGDWNSGYRNSGDRNSGDQNSGEWNSGNWNVGGQNAGSWNTGSWNLGDWNTGDFNTGCCNAGHANTGDWNTGDWNSGNQNTGDWNSGDLNYGIFNTNTNKATRIKIFDELSNWTFADWYKSKAYNIMSCCPSATTNFIYESDMSHDEKKNHPEYKSTGGYLKTIIATKKEKQEWWDKLSDKEKQEIYNIPNFDAEKFEKCTGIKVNKKNVNT